MNRSGLSATIVASFCLVSLPAVALLSDAEEPSMLARVNLPQWPAHSPIKALYRGLPEIALFSNKLLTSQSEALALRLPVPVSTSVSPPSGQPRLAPKATALKPKPAIFASWRHISSHKPFFARLKTTPPAPSPPREGVFMGGLY
jgi:hypothetical protein